MRFGILGPLRVAAHGRASADADGPTGAGGRATDAVPRDAAVATGNAQVLLATLLLNSGRPVALEQLMDALWDETPPTTARAQVQTYVSRLRRVLTAAGMPAALVTHPVGYLIRVDEDDLDAAVFDRLIRQARDALERDDLVEARQRYRAALALWRGPALAGINSRAVQIGASALNERRWTALEECLDVELRLGLAGELVPELTASVEQHPLRERLRAHLMTALYRTGRQADALAVYGRARTVLAEELGVDPGPELQSLYHQILTTDPDLLRAERAGASADGSNGPPVDRRARTPAGWLPRPAADFTGRAESVEYLLTGAGQAAAGPVVQLIDGMAGSGKTTLAVHVAHLLAPVFPHAQLFVDLYGHGHREPLSPSAALIVLLRQLGIPSERIPTEPEERASLWRTELSGRRVLVVLDNAASSAQVAPLLPASADSVTLVTSRRRLQGLDGVRPRSLPVLDPTEAVEMLGRVAGADRVAAEADAAAAVVRRCGYLPLAIRLAGARLAHRPQWKVADFLERLSIDRPMIGLAAEDRTIASTFELSYGPLTEELQRVFRLLGLCPGERFDEWAVAALADLPLVRAGDLLTELVDRHLLEEPTPGRYRLHDLLREYAASLGTADPDGHLAPVRRLLDYYLHAAASAAAGLETPASRQGLQFGDPLRPDLVDYARRQGREWLEVERPNLVSLVHAAADHGLHRYAWQLARACARFFFLHGYTDDLLDTHHRALPSAKALDAPTAVAMLHNYVAGAHFRIGDYRRAVTSLEMAIDLHTRSGDDVVVFISRQVNLATVYSRLGEHSEALRLALDSLSVARRLDWTHGMAIALDILGSTYASLGRLSEALKSHRLSLFLWIEMRLAAEAAISLGNLGHVRARLGHHAAARRLLTVAAREKRRHNNRYGVAETLNDLAVVHRDAGSVRASLALHEEALGGMRDVGDWHGECLVLNEFARTLHIAGDVSAAARLYRRALYLAEHHNHPYRQADALQGLAACLATDDPAAARNHWEQALIRYRELGLPQQFGVADQLRRLEDDREEPQ